VQKSPPSQSVGGQFLPPPGQGEDWWWRLESNHTPVAGKSVDDSLGCKSAVPPDAHGNAHDSVTACHELAEIAASWASLSPAVRAAVLEVIRSVAGRVR